MEYDGFIKHFEVAFEILRVKPGDSAIYVLDIFFCRHGSPLAEESEFQIPHRRKNAHLGGFESLSVSSRQRR